MTRASPRGRQSCDSLSKSLPEWSVLAVVTKSGKVVSSSSWLTSGREKPASRGGRDSTSTLMAVQATMRVVIPDHAATAPPESGEQADYDGGRRKRGSEVHLAVDTSGHVVALHVTPADVDERAEAGRLSAQVRAETPDSVEMASVDQGYSRPMPASAASARGITLEVIKAPEARCGFVLPPRRWVVERSFAWATSCRRLIKDHERNAGTLPGLHLVAFVRLILRQAENP